MAFRIAVSGLNAAVADLDVTGNNIANANTTGFKIARAQFGDVFATSNLGTTTDAMGQGVQLASVDQQFTQGNIAFTENSLDLAVNGQGFFIVEDSVGSRLYTRAGAFGVNEDNFVVDAHGQKLLAFQTVGGSVTGALGTLQLNPSLNPQATSAVDVGVNLNSAASVPSVAFDPADPTSFNDSTSFTVFDSLGLEHLATVFFRKTGANAWEAHLRVDGDNTQTTTAVPLAFDSSGNLTTAMPVSFGTFTPSNGAADLTMSFDFGNSTQFGDSFGVNAISQDGFATGRPAGITIDDSGLIQARFTNGQTEVQGQVALANFANPQGLQPMGNTAWAESRDSGVPLVGAPGTASLGLVQSGALEESNTDLAQQLVNVIIAQRNFQANAQLIQAEDQITQSIINIR